MATTRNDHGHLVRPFADVAEGEIILARGVPLTITKTAQDAPTSGSVPGATVTWMVGTYEGDYLGQRSGLYPFVVRDGDTWTLQRRTDLANVTSYDEGKTWHAPQ